MKARSRPRTTPRSKRRPRGNTRRTRQPRSHQPAQATPVVPSPTPSLLAPTVSDGGADRCQRCQGLLVTDTCEDHLGTYRVLLVWRCVNCGFIQDRQ